MKERKGITWKLDQGRYMGLTRQTRQAGRSFGILRPLRWQATTEGKIYFPLALFKHIWPDTNYELLRVISEEGDEEWTKTGLCVCWKPEYDVGLSEPGLPWCSGSHMLCLNSCRPVADYLDETAVQGLKQIHQQVGVSGGVPLTSNSLYPQPST